MSIVVPIAVACPARARQRLVERAAERNFSLAALSAMVGRNAAYLQQYVKRGTPAVLPEETRRHLAMCLDIDERELGARDPWSPFIVGPARSEAKVDTRGD